MNMNYYEKLKELKVKKGKSEYDLANINIIIQNIKNEITKLNQNIYRKNVELEEINNHQEKISMNYLAFYEKKINSYTLLQKFSYYLFFV